MVPATFKTDDGFKLGKWVGKQRTAKANDKLPDDRRPRLEALGFVWDPHSTQWDIAFKALEHYKREYGDCLVPNKFKAEDGVNLGQWVSNQRRTKDKLSDDRKQRLDALGFV